ncbi:hypothetical protein [Sphingomonas sp. dw_22]|uniref:hypothetical protein n=1 Tax=Sphingomonas sp. dw_22 TaxID=2721175 RepID=UPI001BD40EF6|nr:hypothetical protein [Sphingomonas sp. dw_22]
MQLRSRRVRIAVVLALAIFAAFLAWRTSQPSARKPACVPGRHEEKDASGKVVKITHTTCTPSTL